MAIWHHVQRQPSRIMVFMKKNANNPYDVISTLRLYRSDFLEASIGVLWLMSAISLQYIQPTF
ncbi:hypothetical protein GALMADRAFT_242606 [Galerina marginata CBS 339.88]|uniref:Uncharacterized protein n=1 Tax=Galerina marginata (strain CBS 339.88) TaxID=685588 RepID=A0A067TMR9_GALM3|nr:hypothetical protein GALMADRAFT_242606 [Galerina marginata CBS 339.88]